MFHVPEKNRITDHPLFPFYGNEGNNGIFQLDSILSDRKLFIVASDGLGWEHVSIHAVYRKGILKTPAWNEMCYIKDIFWDSEDIVVQFHPKKSEYVNNHENTLHLWRSTNREFGPIPESFLVGFK